MNKLINYTSCKYLTNVTGPTGLWHLYYEHDVLSLGARGTGPIKL